ncbi:MAG TPA: glycoside hydrolase family 76 protein [Pedobacter sp.]|nr:glycoside hydrolase family 76 protein [Pedobacter sp.]
MNSLNLRSTLILTLSLLANYCFAQTSGISSGTIYTLKSKTNNKLLNVHNASVNEGAIVNTWSNTQSDAQKWMVKHINKDVYTLTNVASGKLLHLSSAAADSVVADQADDADRDDVKWVIKKAATGVYFLRSAANPNFSLNLHTGGLTDGTKADLSKSSKSDHQKWVFQKANPQAFAPTPAIANQVFNAWYNQYKIETFKGFWDRAEMMEILLDAYEVTKDQQYLTKFDAMYSNFILQHTGDWMDNKFNDDIAWAAIFCVRAYLHTGNKIYLEKSKDQFDKMYARAFTNKYGGGLNWFETKTSKNACIQGPAIVASCYLAEATGDKTYYDKAIALYSWSKVYLFDQETGKVNDNIDLDKKTGLIKVGTWSSTYNQGTFLGAAVMLHKYTKEANYLQDAQRIAKYIREDMYKGGVMNNEDGGNDLPGFKGIFARYARMYTLETQQTDLVDWLQLNAKVAYNNRNSQDLIHTRWATRTPELRPKSAFGASTAVSLIMNTLPLGQL